MRRKAREESDVEDYPSYEEEPIASTSGSGENEDFFARHKYFIFAAIAVFMLLAAATAVFVLPALSGTATGKDLLAKLSFSKLFAGSTDTNTVKNTAAAGTTNVTKTATKPTLLSLDILEAPYTNSQSVTLSLFARNAEQCRYANEDGSWSNYEPYEVDNYWQLTAGDDAKTVSYQCKNGDKESEIVTASITLDTTAPEVTLSASGSKSSVTLETQTSDSLSGVKTCQIYIDGNSVDSFPGGDYSKQYATNLATGTHAISVSCKDAAGNTGVAQASLTVDATKTETTKAETKKNRQITVKINGGAAETESRYATLDLYAEEAVLCKYRDDGSAWTAYEGYETARAWTFTSDSGKRTVYYECNDKNGLLVGSTSDDITFSRAVGGGSSSGSTGGTGGTPQCPTNQTRCGDGVCRTNCTGHCNVNLFWCYADSSCRAMGYNCSTNNGTGCQAGQTWCALQGTCRPTGYSCTNGSNATCSGGQVLCVDGLCHANCTGICASGQAFCADGNCHANCSGICAAGQFWCSNESACRPTGYNCTNSTNVTANPPVIDAVALIPTAGSFLAADYTNDVHVTLEINATGASECQYRGASTCAASWCSWAAYTQQQAIQIVGTSQPDGNRTIAVECRNASGTSAAQNATIIFDSTAPTAVDMTNPTATTLLYYNTSSNKTYVVLSWLATADNFGTYSYNIQRLFNGSLVSDYAVLLEDGSGFYQFEEELLPNELYGYAIQNYDRANNVENSVPVMCDTSLVNETTTEARCS